jgi:hypothetical protein
VTSTNVRYSSPSFKGFVESCSKTYTIHIDKGDPLLYLALANVGRGGQGLGRKNRIFDMYVDKNNRVHAGLLCQEGGGQFYRYVEFGTMKITGEGL